MINLQESFIDELVGNFPEITKTGQCTRKQIVSLKGYVPHWFNAYKIDRGLYSIPGGKISKGDVEIEANEKIVAPIIINENTDTSSLIPCVDTNYVKNCTFDEIESIVAANVFFPVYVVGESGNGKSTTVEQVFAKRRKPLIRINMNMMTDEDQLIGTKTLRDGNIEIEEMPILYAMRHGVTVLLDEIDAANSNTILCLQSILEGKPYYFKLKNEIIIPSRGFNIIATANTKGKGSDDGRYIGTNVLNEAFLERFAVTFEQPYPTARVETKIANNYLLELRAMQGLKLSENDKTFIQDVIKWVQVIRNTYTSGGIDENISTRRLVHVIRTYSIFNNPLKAITMCCSRFDDHIKESFINLYQKVSNDEEIVVEKNIDF